MSSVVESFAVRCTAPITSPSYGSATSRTPVRRSSSSCQRLAIDFALLVQPASADQPLHAWESASSAPASARTGNARHFNASNAFTLIETSRACVNSECEPVVKRSEEHTSELQSRLHLVCRLLPEKKRS